MVDVAAEATARPAHGQRGGVDGLRDPHLRGAEPVHLRRGPTGRCCTAAPAPVETCGDGELEALFLE